MKKLFSYLLSSLFLIVIFTGNIFTIDPAFIGSWEFNANSAPWEYNKGTIIFEENNDQSLGGKVVFHTGREIAFDSIDQNGDEITFDVFVDGYDVKVILTLDENNLRGEAITVEGNLPVSATKLLSEE